MATKKQLIDRWKQEPWLTVDRKIFRFFVEHSANASNMLVDFQGLVTLLDGLPYSDEVPAGQDFRGSSFPGAKGIYIEDADFSYCPAIGALEQVNLARVKLNGIRGEMYSVTGKFLDVSFAGAKLKKAFLSNSLFQNCNFRDADLTSADLHGTTLSFCNFQNAHCQRADFQQTDIRGSNFQGADLSDVMFRGVTLDETTDFRGSRLVNLVTQEMRDKTGNLVLRETNIHQAMIDETTQFGNLSGSVDRRILKLIVKEAQREKTPWAQQLIHEVQHVEKKLAQDSEFRWYEALLASVDSEHRLKARALIERASMEL